METKIRKSHILKSSSNKEIIKKVLSERECDIVVKDKLYRILYEASQADEINMDTDLINECVKTIGLIEGEEQHITEEKMKAMRQNIDRKYKQRQKKELIHNIKSHLLKLLHI